MYHLLSDWGLSRYSCEERAAGRGRPGGLLRPEGEAQALAEHTGPHQVQMDGWIACAPFEQLLHLDVVEAAGGRAKLTMPFLADFAQGAGLLHGGALVSLADTAVVMAIKSLVPLGTHFATVALEARFLRPVRQGMVTALARITRQDERTLLGEATLYDDAGQEVLVFSSTFKIARKRSSA